MASRTRTPIDGLDGIEWLGHAGFRIKTSAGWVYIDPYRAPPGPAGRADPGHPRSLRPLLARRRPAARRRGHACWSRPPRSRSSCAARRVSIAPGDMVDVGRARDHGAARVQHQQARQRGTAVPRARRARPVGYVIRDGGRRIYHSGDTDVIPEMDEAAGVDVALLPGQRDLRDDADRGGRGSAPDRPRGRGADALGDGDRLPRGRRGVRERRARRGADPRHGG